MACGTPEKAAHRRAFSAQERASVMLPARCAASARFTMQLAFAPSTACSPRKMALPPLVGLYYCNQIYPQIFPIHSNTLREESHVRPKVRTASGRLWCDRRAAAGRDWRVMRRGLLRAVAKAAEEGAVAASMLTVNLHVRMQGDRSLSGHGARHNEP